MSKMIRKDPNKAPGYKDPTIKLTSTDNWRTPRPFFDKINREFDLKYDRAADLDNHLLPDFFTKDGHYMNRELVSPMSVLDTAWGYNGWINPPYSNPGDFFRKAHKELLAADVLTVMLVKVATSETYWTDTGMDAHIRYLRGRMKFWDEQNQPHYTANFPSALIIFAPYTKGNPNSSYWDYRPDTPVKLY